MICVIKNKQHPVPNLTIPLLKCSIQYFENSRNVLINEQCGEIEQSAVFEIIFYYLTLAAKAV